MIGELESQAMSNPDTITTLTQAKAELEADAADIYFTVAGSALFSGEQAFKRAKEVKLLTELLIESGIEENQIKLRNVRVDSSSFALIKSSSANYSLKVAKVDLEKLSDVLGIIGAQKNCTMNWLEWIYSRQEELRNELRATALREAIELAKQDAAILMVELEGIYNLEEQARHDSVSREYIGADEDFALSAMKRKRAASVDLGIALGNTTDVQVRLRTEFRVSKFGSQST
jgi:uncharacterized protein YggE